MILGNVGDFVRMIAIVCNDSDMHLNNGLINYSKILVGKAETLLFLCWT